MEIIKSFDIKNLLPFKKRDGMPEGGNGQEEKILELDSTLNHEEQVYVGHYIAFADLLLDTPEPRKEPIEKRVVEMPAQNGKPAIAPKMEKGDEAA